MAPTVTVLISRLSLLLASESRR